MNWARWLKKQRWHYVLRLQCDTRVEVAPGLWPRLDAMGLRPGQRRRIDSRRQRRLSYFLLGLRWLEHSMALSQQLTLLLPPHHPLEVTI